MTESALRPDSAGPRSGSDFRSSNRIGSRFAGIGGVRESTAAEVPLGLPGDRERPRSVAVRRLDRSGGDLRPSNRDRDCFVGIGVGRSAVAEAPPGGAAERERRPRMVAAPRHSHPTASDGSHASAKDPDAAARLVRRLVRRPVRRPVALGERRDTPEATR